MRNRSGKHKLWNDAEKCWDVVDAPTLRRVEAAKEAADAHTALNVFAVVINVLEGGTLPGARGLKAANRIIEIAKAEQQRQLRGTQRYDRFRARQALDDLADRSDSDRRVERQGAVRRRALVQHRLGKAGARHVGP